MDVSCWCTEGSIKLVDEGEEFTLEVSSEPSGSPKSGAIKPVGTEVDVDLVDVVVDNDDAISVECPCDTCEDRC